jgi:hypothetical protein
MTRRVPFPPAFLVFRKREGHTGKVTMPEDSAARPFEWSEIHDQVEKKIPELVKASRAEIGAAIKSVPPPGGARQRFFALLGEKLDDCADRAANICKECLTEIGREDAPGASLSIWSNSLRSFIEEDLRSLGFLACGIGPHEKELMLTRVSRRPFSGRGWGSSSPKAADLRSQAHQIGVIVELVRTRMEKEFIQPVPNNHVRAIAVQSIQAAALDKPTKKRTPRTKELCYEGAANIIKEDLEIDRHSFCIQMDRKAAQTSQNAKYLPPAKWGVRTFGAQLNKRPNTVSRFMTTVRTKLREDGPQ